MPDANGYYLYTNNDYAVYKFSGRYGELLLRLVVLLSRPVLYHHWAVLFVVKGISNGAGMATFNNTMRKVADDDQFFRNSNEDLPKHRFFWLKSENSGGGL